MKSKSNKQILKRKKIIYFLLLFLVLIIFSFKYVYDTKKDDFFSIIVMPDTQKYTKYEPDVFCKQTEWIVNNIENLQIKYVAQMGDIVDDGAKNPKEWEIASKCMNNLDGKIPYGILPGNHDSDTINNNETGFASYDNNFGPSRFEKFDWYAGHYKNNRNNYQVLNGLGIQLLFMNLQIEPENDVLDWAEKEIKKYKEAYVVLSTHKYLPDSNIFRDNKIEFSKNGNTGEDIWKKLVSKNCSIKMVWSGHYHDLSGENHIFSKNNCGEDIPQITQNYQDRVRGGDGIIRIYKFFPKTKKITVQTFSTFAETFEEDNDSQFTLPFQFYSDNNPVY